MPLAGGFRAPALFRWGLAGAVHGHGGNPQMDAENNGNTYKEMNDDYRATPHKNMESSRCLFLLFPCPFWMSRIWNAFGRPRIFFVQISEVNKWSKWSKVWKGFIDCEKDPGWCFHIVFTHSFHLLHPKNHLKDQGGWGSPLGNFWQLLDFGYQLEMKLSPTRPVMNSRYPAWWTNKKRHRKWPLK